MFKVINYIGLFILFVSCTSSTNSNITSYKKDSNDTLVYDYKSFREYSPYFVGNEDGIDTTYFFIKYPQFSDQKINDNIRKYILIDGENTVAEAAQSFIDGFDEFAGDSNLKSISAAWSKEVNTNIILNTPILLTLVTHVNEYSGGAHGQHYSMYKNFDVHRRTPITIEDIIQKSKIEEFRQIAEHYFRKQEKISKDASLDKDFFFQDGKFAINDNFGFTKNSLIIHYNEYEIKPYSEGPTRLEIPYQAINDILNIRGHEYIKSIL